MKKLDGQSYDNVNERIEALKDMFPEAVSEGRLDYDTLMALLGDEFDNDQEKYSFTWKGKLNALRLAQKRSTGTLRPSRGDSVDWDTTGNLFIEGDNLEVLKLLQRGYLRKVKMIYIDPPYNTGNDFVYEDDFADTIGRYKQVTGQALRANPETAGRYHSNWLNMMYPRLKIAKTLLRDDGVIFISIDDNEQANLKKLCDEVFGEENFVANIIWQKKYSPSNDHKTICPLHDFVMVYRRSESWQRNLLKRSEENDKQYKFEDEHGVFRASDYTCNKTSQERPNLFYPITNPKTGEEVWPKPSRVWAYSQEAHNENMKNGLVFWGRDGKAKVPSYKRYLDSLIGGGGVVPSTWWTFEFAGHNDEAAKETNELLENRVFNTPKPTKLITRLLELTTNPNEDHVILDFFAGSCTTAHAIMQLNAEDNGNRKFICVQLPEATNLDSEAFKAGYKNICEIGKERIRRAGVKIKQEAGLLPQDLDIGFRVFKLDTSNLKEWDDTYIAEDVQTILENRMEQMLDQFKPDRTTEDILYEVLLKYGYPLTTPLSKAEFCGKTFYVAGDGDFFICLDSGITPEIAEQAADYTPGAMIFADGCFAHDDDIANVNLVLEKREIEFRWV